MSKQFQQNFSDKNRLFPDGASPLYAGYTVSDPTAKYSRGQIVKLVAEGEVDFCATADVPFGFVTVENNPDDPNGDYDRINCVTVREFAADHTYGIAQTAVTAGDLVAPNGVSGVDATYSQYNVAASGALAVGIALSDGGVGEEFKVALFNAPIQAV